MSVYVDALTGCLVHDNWNWTRSCHLMADTEKELLRFGAKIGCRPQWLQHSRVGLPHFDITARMRQRAIEHGAIDIDRKKTVERIRRYAG